MQIFNSTGGQSLNPMLFKGQMYLVNVNILQKAHIECMKENFMQFVSMLSQTKSFRRQVGPD